MRSASRAALVAAIVCVSPFAAPRTLRADTSHVFSTQTFDSALAQTGQGRVLVIMFSAKWCGPCKAMEQTSWSDPGVAAWVQNHGMALHVDVDENKSLADRFDVRSLPLLIAIRDGQVIERSLGYKDATTLTSWLDTARTGAPMGAVPPAGSSPPALFTSTVAVAAPSAPQPQPSAAPSTLVTTTHVVAAPGKTGREAATAPRAQKDRVDPARALKDLQGRHAQLQETLKSNLDQDAKNTARKAFRTAAGKAYAAELKARRTSSATELRVLATELDDTGWMRLALVQAAIGAGQYPSDLSQLLDQAQAKGVDVTKTRASLAKVPAAND